MYGCNDEYQKIITLRNTDWGPFALGLEIPCKQQTKLTLLILAILILESLFLDLC